MIDRSSPSPLQLKLLGLCFPAVIGLCLIAAAPVRACLPAPGSRPAPLEERVSSVPYVFAGRITQVDRDVLTIRVNRYFKGEGPQVLQLSGFNQHSCQDMIAETGGRYLFFAEPGEKGVWNAVYDGAFGSVRSWSEEIEAELRNLEKPNSSQSALPRSVANAVKRAAARETGRSAASVQILRSEARTWSDNCLGLPFPDRGCLRVTVEGWLVTARVGGRELTYRTDAGGSIVYRDGGASSDRSLPPSVAEAVKREASRLSGIARDRLQIINAEPQTWPNGCLGIEVRDRACTLAMVEGWRVELRGGNKRFIYRTDSRGNAVYLENGVDLLPANVRSAVLAAAARQTQLSRRQLRISDAFPQVWDGCLGIYEDPRQPCTKIAIFGWQVVVEGSDDSLLVYHTNQNGSDTRLNVNASRLNAEEGAALPAGVRKAVVAAAARQTGLRGNQLRVTEAQRRTWNGCLGIESDRRACTEIGIPGWRVTVEGGNNRLIYHADGNGSDVRFNAPESRWSGDRATNPVRLRDGEVQVSVPQGAIFRAVSSGGFAGGTTEVTLWSDGKVTQRSSYLRDGQPQTRWVSRQQVRAFRQILRQQRFNRYDGLDFPPPPGSADIIGITLASRRGVARVADYDRDKLPQPLQTVLTSWEELLESASERPAAEKGYRRNGEAFRRGDRATRSNSQSNPLTNFLHLLIKLGTN